MSAGSPFALVPLYTSDGEHVGVNAKIPRFKTTPPDVLLWGSRAFMRTEPVSSPTTQYRECFAVAVVDTERA